jgi:hypothetical protein
LDEEVGGDLPTCVDLLDHLQSEGSPPRQHFGGARARAENVCKLGLAMSELLDRVMQYVDGVEPALAAKR